MVKSYSSPVEQDYVKALQKILNGILSHRNKKGSYPTEEDRDVQSRAEYLVGLLSLKELAPSVQFTIPHNQVKKDLDFFIQEYSKSNFFIPLKIFTLDEDFTDTVAFVLRALANGYRHLRQTGKLEADTIRYTDFIGIALNSLKKLAQIRGEGNTAKVCWGPTKDSPGNVYFTWSACSAIYALLEANLVNQNEVSEFGFLLTGASNWLPDLIEKNLGCRIEEDKDSFTKAATGYFLQTACQIFRSNIKNSRLGDECQVAFNYLSQTEWTEDPTNWLSTFLNKAQIKESDLKKTKDQYSNDKSGIYIIMSALSNWMEIKPDIYYHPSSLGILQETFKEYMLRKKVPKESYLLQRFFYAVGSCWPIIMKKEIPVNLLSLRAAMRGIINHSGAADFLAKKLFDHLGQ